MRYNTHEHTPRRKTSTTIKGLLALCAILIYGMFALVSFGCFYYGHSIIGGICTILLSLALTLWGLIPMWDMYRAYIQIDGDFIRVVDYYSGFKKEQIYSFSDITSAEIALGNSFRVRGYRMTFAATQYIILKHGKKSYLKLFVSPKQKRFLSDIFATDNTAEWKYHSAVLSVKRKRLYGVNLLFRFLVI